MFTLFALWAAYQIGKQNPPQQPPPQPEVRVIVVKQLPDGGTAL